METPLIETQIVLNVPDQGLEQSTLANLQAGFADFFTKAEEWRQKAVTIKVTSADQKGDMKLARVARLELKNIRVDAEKTRKRLKEDSLRMGKAIDGINNVLLAAIVPIEQYLEDQEKFGERLAAEAKQRILTEWREAIQPFLRQGQLLPDLAAMTEDQFQSVLADAKTLHEARVEAERKAEEERLAKEAAEAAERKRIFEENERLKREAAEREAAAKAEREKAEAARLAAEESARKEREAIEAKAAAERKAAEEAARAAEAKAQAERDKILKEAQEAARVAEEKAAEERRKLEAEAEYERATRARMEAELAKKAAEEKAALEAKAAAAKKAARDPDKAKALEFAATVRALQCPAFATVEGKAVSDEINAKVSAFATWIEGRAATL